MFNLIADMRIWAGIQSSWYIVTRTLDICQLIKNIKV